MKIHMQYYIFIDSMIIYVHNNLSYTRNKASFSLINFLTVSLQ